MIFPEPRFARVAALIADPSRARMLALLLGGEARSAGELARAGAASPLHTIWIAAGCIERKRIVRWHLRPAALANSREYLARRFISDARLATVASATPQSLDRSKYPSLLTLHRDRFPAPPPGYPASVGANACYPSRRTVRRADS